MLYTHDKSFNGMLVFLCALARNPLASVGAISMLLWALLPAVAHAAAGDADAAFGVGGYVHHAASKTVPGLFRAGLGLDDGSVGINLRCALLLLGPGMADLPRISLTHHARRQQPSTVGPQAVEASYA